MDRIETQVYQQLLGTTNEVPLGIRKLHERFLQVWKRTGHKQHDVPAGILALIAVLAEDSKPQPGQAVIVDGAEGEYISPWKAGTVRVKFPGDTAAFRVVPEDKVQYV